MRHISVAKEESKITEEVVIDKIVNSTKVEALIGAGIVTLIGLMTQRIINGDPVPVEIFWGLALLGGFYFALQLMAYLKFYIQKMVFLKEQREQSENALRNLEAECEKLELQRKIRALEAVTDG